ncbi:translation initiation factor IF-2 N-terminal domain-containing protein [Gordonia sp. CPCC 206044]|uniref:translation initiation factor IF-2 N-terminal domain-containing protein n=1 Tax=Gordonia sp. CPCC 206044 TaxID=3140793 RepID=UPI003AF34B1C
MTDNGSPTDANAASESAEEFDFPSRLRVHALARSLGLTSRQVLAHLAELGIETRSPQSSIDREVALTVAARVRAHVEVDETEVEAVEDAADSAGPSAAVASAPAAEVPAPASEVPAPAVESAAEPVAAVDVPTDTPQASEVSTESAPVAESAVVETATDKPSESAVAQDETATVAAPDDTTAADTAAADTTAADTTAADTTAVDTAAEATSTDTIPADTTAADTVAEDTSTDTAAVEATPAVATDDSTAAKSDAAAEDTAGDRAAVERDGNTEAPTLFSAVEQTQHHPVRHSAEAFDTAPLFLQPQPVEAPQRTPKPTRDADAEATADERGADHDQDDDSNGDGERTARRRRRGRRGRGRGRGDQNDANGTDETSSSGADSSDESAERETDDSDNARPSGKKNRKTKRTSSDEETADDSDSASAASDESDDSGADDDEQGSSKRRRRRRRRKGGSDGDESSPDDPPNTVVHEREPRSKRARDEVQGISGSTRLEAKRQRRRDGRDAGRRRPPILSESEFLARREAVDRVMVVRERSANSKIVVDGAHESTAPVEDYTQIAVLEDGVLVEHFVTTETSSSMVGNIYLGRVQNVLPGMEAAFVDIGRGRNGVLYAGEVNWDAAGLDGGSRKIEQALKPGDNVLVQVSKDPVGHKGARLTTQISLAGRYLVYVPGGTSTGISRKLPDVERKRLKSILGKLVPDDAGVIIRTASEGVSAEDLGADIERLEKKWKDIDAAVGKTKGGNGSAPQALYEEPDLLVRVVRDLFNEDFKKLVVEGGRAWDLVERYVSTVAPDLMDRIERFEKAHADAPDSFVVHRIDEQLAKALDRKVWLPSGGTLIIEHTEAMTVIDVNTGKFTGSGGNLEETVTRNNLEAAEEIVRQMRLRDIGGMIIVDFIDMVLESNRDLVLRRLTEALARDRTRHQVSEVTSLGLVQMTRKRLGTGLLEAFSTTCTHCGGRGIIVHSSPVEVRSDDAGRSDGGGSGKKSRRGRRKSEAAAEPQKPAHNPAEHPMFRAMAAHAHEDMPDGAVDASSEDGAHARSGTEVTAGDTSPVEDRPKRSDDARDTGTDKVSTEAADGSATQRSDTQRSDEPVAVKTGRAGKPATTKADNSAKTDAATTDAGKSEDTAEAGTAEQAGSAAEATATPETDGKPETAATPEREPDATATPGTSEKAAPKRRRRVVRQAAAPPTASEPVVVTADAASTSGPLTTFGPTGGTSDATVAVRRRPRRRTAGRPAGPPPADE